MSKAGDRGKRKSSRLSRKDWEVAALNAIEIGGVANVSVERLAETLGITKGSFYWHFGDRDALIRAALARWEKEATEDIIARLNEFSDPKERLQRLLDSVAGPRHLRYEWRIESALSASLSHSFVRIVLQRVTEGRIGYMASCFEEMGLSHEEARDRAVLVYAALLGLVQLMSEGSNWLSDERLQMTIKQLLHSLLPDS